MPHSAIRVTAGTKCFHLWRDSLNFSITKDIEDNWLIFVSQVFILLFQNTFLAQCRLDKHLRSSSPRGQQVHSAKLWPGMRMLQLLSPFRLDCCTESYCWPLIGFLILAPSIDIHLAWNRTMHCTRGESNFRLNCWPSRVSHGMVPFHVLITRLVRCSDLASCFFARTQNSPLVRGVFGPNKQLLYPWQLQSCSVNICSWGLVTRVKREHES